MWLGLSDVVGLIGDSDRGGSKGTHLVWVPLVAGDGDQNHACKHGERLGGRSNVGDQNLHPHSMKAHQTWSVYS